MSAIFILRNYLATEKKSKIYCVTESVKSEKLFKQILVPIRCLHCIFGFPSISTFTEFLKMSPLQITILINMNGYIYEVI